MFITATKKIEKYGLKPYETVEVSKEKAEQMLKNENIVRRAWECVGCGELHTENSYGRKPPFCQNPNCKVENLMPIHPTKHHEIGDVLKQNYIFKTMNTTENIYRYTGNYKFEKKGSESLIKGKTKEILPNCKNHKQKEVLEHIRTSTYIPQEKFGIPKQKIAVKNGILNLETEKLEELDPEEEIPITKIPVKYDPDAKCPYIRNFFHDVVSREDVPILQEMFGYCLWKAYPIAKAFMLVGNGANGKSTLLNLLERLIGKQNIATPSLQELVNNKFSKVRLYGKLANIHADLSNSKLEQTGSFKMLTGGDIIEGEQKWVQETLDFYNHAKLIYSANELPKTGDRTDAFFRRWIIIDFPNHFAENDPKTDPNILEKITTDEEMSGLLNWSIEGLKRVLDNESFSHSKSRDSIKNKWFIQSDSLRAFVSMCLTDDKDGVIPKKDLQIAYEAFCEKHDISYIAKKGQVTKRLPTIIPSAQGGSDNWYRPNIDGERRRCWTGISFEEGFLSKGFVPDEVKTHVQDVRANNISSYNFSENNSNNNNTSSQTLDTPDMANNSEKNNDDGGSEVMELGEVEDLEDVNCEQCREDLGIEKEAVDKVGMNGREVWLCEDCKRSVGFE